MTDLPDDRCRFTVVVDRAVDARVRELAKRERRNFSAQVQLILEKGLAVIEAEQGQGNAATA